MLQLFKVFEKVFSRQYLVYRILSLFLLVTVYWLLSTPTYADNEFSSSYNINYDVDPSGVTTVTEKVTLKNLTDRFYASSFNLSIGATNITEVAATDSQGPLEISTQNQGKKTAMTVKFSQQVAGVGKEYPFTIKFKSTDFAQPQGKVWQISIPKISSVSNLDKYDLSLSVPVAFGDPTSILPEPIKQSETQGKINFFYTKSQLTESGILANFGDKQIFNFSIYYYLENSGLLPEIKEVVLPADSNYQKVLINSIEPKPENTHFDPDGNLIATIKLERGQKINLEITGSASLKLKSNQKEELSPIQQQQYLSAQKYWEKDNPQISGKLNEIFKDLPAQAGQKPQSINEKAKLIYKFVVSTLSYNQDRLKNNDYQRLGALTALNNPTQALCQEFSDLFVSLARAAGIPARELTGYAYSANSDIRPLSLSKDTLHAWAQYYDPVNGWVMVDPTWENTTGGVDYFSQFDLNHLILAIRGQNSEQPTPASDVRVEFGETEATSSSKLNIQILAPDELFAAFPSNIKVVVENQGNVATDSAQFNISAGKLDIAGVPKSLGTSFLTPKLPPFGRLEYEYSLKSHSATDGFEDQINVQFGSQTASKKVLVKPFFAFSFFSFGIIGIAVLIILIYLFTAVFHIKYHHHLQSSGKKKS